MKKSIIYFLLFLSLISSCVTDIKQLEVNDLIGIWFYNDKDQSYIEVYIDKSSIKFYSDEEGWSGPFSYDFQNNILKFHSIQYKVEDIKCNILSFTNPDFNIKLTRIDCLTIKENTSDINPYYLRRCNYLVNNGIISMTDALEYLNSIVLNNEDEFIDETYLINR